MVKFIVIYFLGSYPKRLLHFVVFSQMRSIPVASKKVKRSTPTKRKRRRKTSRRRKSRRRSTRRRVKAVAARFQRHKVSVRVYKRGKSSLSCDSNVQFELSSLSLKARSYRPCRNGNFCKGTLIRKVVVGEGANVKSYLMATERSRMFLNDLLSFW